MVVLGSVLGIALALLLAQLASPDAFAQDGAAVSQVEKPVPDPNEGSDSGQEEGQKSSPDNCELELTWDSPLVVVQGLWMLLVTVGAALYSYCAGKKNGVCKEELRGLNLPRGSLRAMLALLLIGSFINVMVLGAPVFCDDGKFDSILAAFGALTGSVIGFYFGARGSTKPPNSKGSPKHTGGTSSAG